MNDQTDEKTDLTPRLFVALWPEPELREQLVLLSRALRGASSNARWVPGERLHLTLQYLGRMPVSLFDDLVQALGSVDFEGFTLSLDRLGVFERARVLWLGPGRTPPPLARLHERLLSALDGFGASPLHARYRPHVTLARKWRGEPPVIGRELEALLPVVWTPQGFALVESLDSPEGVSYRLIRRFG